MFHLVGFLSASCVRSIITLTITHDERLTTVGACTESCQFDNFQCSHWWKYCQNYNIFVSVTMWLQRHMARKCWRLKNTHTHHTPQGWFKHSAEPMRDAVTKQHRLSLARRKPRISTAPLPFVKTRTCAMAPGMVNICAQIPDQFDFYFTEKYRWRQWCVMINMWNYQMINHLISIFDFKLASSGKLHSRLAKIMAVRQCEIITLRALIILRWLVHVHWNCNATLVSTFSHHIDKTNGNIITNDPTGNAKCNIADAKVSS